MNDVVNLRSAGAGMVNRPILPITLHIKPVGVVQISRSKPSHIR